jgi:hypothetical protein
MDKVMVSFDWTGESPDLAAVRKRFGLAEDEIDAEFGVIEIDPQQHSYTALVTPEAAARITGREAPKVEGPFANPRIEPFGPPRK